MESFSVFQKRINILRETLLKKDIDAFIFFKPENIAYLTGFARQDMLIVDREEVNLFVNFCLYHQYKTQQDLIKVFCCSSPLKALAKFSKNKKFKRIAVEENFISYNRYKLLEKELKINIFPQKDLLVKMRQIKDEEEIKILKKAAEITDIAFNYILSFLKEDVEEYEICIEVEYFLKKYFKIKELAFPPIVAAEKNSAIPHHSSGNYKIKYGDCIIMDFGVIFSGYCSDLTRTVFLGKIESEKKKVYNAVKNAQKIAIENIKEGKRCKEIDRIVRDYLKGKGLEKYFGHNLGHSIGREIHELPSLSRYERSLIKKGMVFTIEPGVYIVGKFGVRIEDMVVVNKDGPELLTKSSKELLII